MVWDYSFPLVLYGYYLKIYSNGGIYIDVRIYLILIFISGGSGIGFMTQNNYTEAIIAFVICILLFGLLYYYLKRNKRKKSRL